MKLKSHPRRMYGLCGQLLLKMFTFIFWPCQIIKGTTFDGNRLGNEMYSNMLAVLFLFQHTFFSIPVVFSHSSLPLPACRPARFARLWQSLVRFPFLFVSFCRWLCQTQLVRPANWAGKWHGLRRNISRWLCRLECFRFVVRWGNVEIVWFRRVKFKTHFNYGNLTCS